MYKKLNKTDFIHINIMNFLPSEIEDLINNYKYQLEHKEKMIKLNEEFKNRYTYHDKEFIREDKKEKTLTMYSTYNMVYPNLLLVNLGIVIETFTKYDTKSKIYILYDYRFN